MIEKTDIQLFPSPLEPKTPKEVSQRLFPLGLAVCMASSRPAGLEISSPIHCRLTPDCKGHYWVRRLDIPDQIECTCSECDAEEVIVNWRETWWDFHRELLRFQLSREERKFPAISSLLSSTQILQIGQTWSLPRSFLLTIYRAKKNRKQYQIRLSPSDQDILEELLHDPVAAEKIPQKTQKALQHIMEK
jgi:hypothetical protein